MCEEMVTLETYVQKNCDLPKKPYGFGSYSIEFQVEKEWLERLLSYFEWGTVERFLSDYTWDDSELIFRTYQDYQSRVAEWCSSCEVEVELPKQFKAHRCPNCNEIIFPCAQCEKEKCSDCPLER